MIITYSNHKKMWVSKMKDNGDAMNTSFVSFRIGDILERRLFGTIWDCIGSEFASQFQALNYPLVMSK